ncbi:MAG: hypothetical protein GXZ08_02465 [Tissierellia bacterium]|nr:hypothetical protein [Tissierellia bacterium]
MEQCILSYNNREEVLELPVPLQEWGLESGNNTYKFTTMNTGDIKAIGNSKLKVLNISSFFPNHDYSFLLGKRIDPFTCVNIIEKWRQSGKPIRVIIVGTDINLAMSIENFVYGKEDGSGDIPFSLSLEEYRFLNTPNFSIPQPVDELTELKDRATEEKPKTPGKTSIKKSGKGKKNSVIENKAVSVGSNNTMSMEDTKKLIDYSMKDYGGKGYDNKGNYKGSYIVSFDEILDKVEKNKKSRDKVNSKVGANGEMHLKQ